jgi:hypothetical protein
MWLCYLIAFIPVVVGGIFWMTRREIVLWEWLLGASAGFITSAIFHICIITSMTGDNETWSGRATEVVFLPEWVERYTEVHTRTTGSGKYRVTTTYTDVHYRTHPQEWQAEIDFGEHSETRDISKSRFDEIKGLFGGQVNITKPYKSGFYSGDPNAYHTPNKTGFIYPATTWMRFENRVKAAPSVFSYPKVDAKAPVFEYPSNSDGWVSNRIIGGAPIPIRLWDQMNARLGPSKFVNVILVGFNSADSGLASLQEAKWIGGKKNDLVLCYGTDGKKVLWTRVFGWSEREDAKRNLETILLQNPIDISIIDKIEYEIKKNYVIKDWHKFDYITVEPPPWTFLVLVVVMIVTQIVYYRFAFQNDSEKGQS